MLSLFLVASLGQQCLAFKVQTANAELMGYPWTAISQALKSPEPSRNHTERIVKSQEMHHDFGYPAYPENLPQWPDLEKTIAGRVCSMGEDTCEQLVCRKGICSYCEEDTECPSMHNCIKHGKHALCEMVKMKAWEQAISDPSSFLCTMLILVSSALAAAAGTGGGSIFVPILISLSSLKASAVVALAQFMILVGSLVNLSVFVTRRHPDFPELPVIDYDCMVALIPTLSLGVTLGVLVNRTAPSWLLLVLLSSTLCFALYRTASKGWRQWQQEVAVVEANAINRQTSEEERLSARRAAAQKEIEESVPEATSYGNAISEIISTRRQQVIGIVSVWLLMVFASQHGFSYCSMGYALVLGILTVLLLLASLTVSWWFRSTSHMNPIDWLNSTQAGSCLKFPLVAFCTGFLGAMLGLGGGILLSPVFLEVGMHSEAVQATTASFVFLSSSVATIQYYKMDQIVWHYAVWYGCVTLVGTYLGQTLCEVFIRKRKRYSFITLAVASVLGASLVCLLIVGLDTVIQDFEMGRPWWFSYQALCKAGRAEILADHEAGIRKLER